MGGSSLWPSPDTRLIGQPQRRSMIPCEGSSGVPGALVYYKSQESEYYQELLWRLFQVALSCGDWASTRRVRSNLNVRTYVTVTTGSVLVSLSLFSFSPWRDWMSEKGFWRLAGFVCRLWCTIDGWLHGSVKLVIVLLQLDPIILPRHPPLFSSTCHCASKYNETLPLRTPTLRTREGNF